MILFIWLQVKKRAINLIINNMFLISENITLPFEIIVHQVDMINQFIIIVSVINTELSKVRLIYVLVIDLLKDIVDYLSVARVPS